MVVGNGLKPLITGIGILLRPIRDILMIGLMPLLYIMRPIGIFFRTLMKPYYQKAMALMRTGAMLQKSGDFGGAMEAYSMGGVQLMTGMIAATTTGLVAAFNILRGVADPVAKAIQTVSGYTKDWIEAIDLASVGIIESAHAAGAINTEQYEKLVSVFLSAGSPETTGAITAYYESIEGITSLFEQLAPGFEGDVGTIATAMLKLGIGINDLALSLISDDIKNLTEAKFGKKPGFSITGALKTAALTAGTAFAATSPGLSAGPWGVAGVAAATTGGGIAGFLGDLLLQYKDIKDYEKEVADYQKEIYPEVAAARLASLGLDSPSVVDVIEGINLTNKAFVESFAEGGTIPTSINQSHTELDDFSKSFKKIDGMVSNVTINVTKVYRTKRSFF